MTPDIPDLHAIVKFGKGIPSEVQGKALFELEKTLRQLTGDKLWIEVFKEIKGDDSKLRSLMTPDQRAKL